MTQRFEKAATILANANCATSYASKIRPNFDTLEENVCLVESTFGKIKGMLGSMDSKIKRVLQVLASMNTTAGISPPTGRVDSGSFLNLAIFLELMLTINHNNKS